MLFYLQNVLNCHSIKWQKYFYEVILMSPLYRETKAAWENMFFSVSIIKLRMFGGENVYISVIGTSTET